MIFSPTSQHALRALLYLVDHSEKGPVQVSRIAASEGIPRPFLSKILHGLRQKGLVSSIKGPGGGFAIKVSAYRMTLEDVVNAIDGETDLAHRCILGRARCLQRTSCALHEPWRELRAQFARTIGAVTLAEAAAMGRPAARGKMRSRGTKDRVRKREKGGEP